MTLRIKKVHRGDVFPDPGQPPSFRKRQPWGLQDLAASLGQYVSQRREDMLKQMPSHSIGRMPKVTRTIQWFSISNEPNEVLLCQCFFSELTEGDAFLMVETLEGTGQECGITGCLILERRALNQDGEMIVQRFPEGDRMRMAWRNDLLTSATEWEPAQRARSPFHERRAEVWHDLQKAFRPEGFTATFLRLTYGERTMFVNPAHLADVVAHPTKGSIIIVRDEPAELTVDQGTAEIEAALKAAGCRIVSVGMDPGAPSET